MRIGIVLPSDSGYSETFFFNKIKGLEAHGHEVVLFVNSKKRKQGNNAIKVKVAPKLSGNIISNLLNGLYALVYALLYHFKVSKRLYDLNKKCGLSFLYNIKNIIVNSHLISERLDWLHFGFGTMAINRECVAEAIGAKMAVSFRGFDIGIYPIKHPGCYKTLWNKVDKIHVISDDIADLVYKNGFQDQAPIIKITPAIDTSYFKNNKPYKHSDKSHFVTIARLHWKKGLAYTLEALSFLKQAGYSFTYTIIGEGEAYESLKFAVHQMNLKDEVVFLGRIPHKEVKDKLRKEDIYLQYSVQEGFCNAVLEAQAMGLLCVVSDAEGLPENVLHGITGFVVPKRQPKQLAVKLAEIIEMDKEQKMIICKQAQKRVDQDFNLENQQHAFDSFYSNGS